MQVIITASHSLCRAKNDKLCDRQTSEIAKKLESKLNSEMNIEPIVYLSTAYRDQMDLNRKISRETIWRKQITKDITNALEDDKISHIIVFDIHSFSNGFGKEAKIVILNNLLSQKEGSQLYKTLLNHDVPGIKMLIGSDKNDIQLEIEHMDQHYSKQIDTLLLEFSDTLSNDELQKIFDAIIKNLKDKTTSSCCLM